MWTKGLFGLVFTLYTGASFAENVVDIIGIREETKRDQRPGHSESITPKEESRFQIDAHLRERSAFDTQGTGRVSASGFLLPRTRGQDAKATQVFVGPFKLFDPLTGFPLVEDLDLRAFGRLHIHRGIAPVSLASTGPIGTLVFSPRAPQPSRLSLGVSHGNPYGSKVFASSEDRGDQWEGRFYLRAHKASGRYAFFDDNATPANDQDDRISWRDDNHAVGVQAVPYGKVQSGAWTLKFLGVYHQAERGVPSLGGRARTFAEVRSQSQLSSVQAERRLPSSELLPDLVGFNYSYRHENRLTEDPQRNILVTTARQKFFVFGQTLSVPIVLTKPTWSLFVTPEVGHVRGATENVQTSEAYALQRRYEQLYTGLSFTPWRRWTLEAKGRWRQRFDAAQDSTGHQAKDKGTSATLGYRVRDWSFYAQAGREERPPSLIEEYGDGSAILSNPSLLPERIDHREIGATYAAQRLGHLTLAYFQDDMQDKIVFIPSLTNAIKAINLQTTNIAGLEFEALYHVSALPIDLGAGLARLQAVDTSTAGKSTTVPFVPAVIGNLFLAHRTPYGTIRTSARHRGTAYADVLNQSPLPSITTYDVSYDFTFDRLACGLNLHNITDIKSAAFRVPGTGERGRRAYTELTGYPLPGRTWQTSCSATL